MTTTVTKYRVLAGCMLMLTSLGGIYAWSAFVPALQAQHRLTNAQTQLLFGLTVGLFTLAMNGTGHLQDRRGPRGVALAGALLYAAGYLVASRSGGSFPRLVLGISVLSGLGMACGYVSALATSVKWFPHCRGLITGVTVAGYGAGAIVLSSVATALMNRGMPVLEVFRWMGLVYGAAVLLGALLLATPPAEAQPAVATPHPAALRDLVRQREFWALAAGMCGGTLAGLVVIGNLKPIALEAGLGAGVATAAISALAVGNAGGRVLWGLVFDRRGRRIIPWSLVMLALAVLALARAAGQAQACLLVALLVGLGYGACLVLYAARIAQVWGAERLGTVYPTMLLFHGLGALVGPGLGGALHDATGSFTWPLLAGGALPLLGALAVWQLRPPSTERPAPRRGTEELEALEMEGAP